MANETSHAAPETAPSAMTEDQVSFARTIGMTGLMAVCLGILILILNAAKAKLGFVIGNNIGFAGIVIGMAMMFFHATRDTDQLIRRLYGFVGGLGLPLSGLILSVLPMIISASKDAPDDGSPKPIISLFFPFGWACFLAGLFFLMPFCRNETDEKQRRFGLIGLGGIGALLAIIGLGGGLVMPSFGPTYGVVMSLLGLGYLCAFIYQLGGVDLEGYKPAIAVGAFGLLVFAIALIRSIFPGNRPFFIPDGLVLMTLGLSYATVAVFLVSDMRLVVLTRRELAAYFYSPVGYLVLLMTALLAWIDYVWFWKQEGIANVTVPEPVVGMLFANFLTVVPVLFYVPAITMRLFSEEKRTGTFEVLVCAPVSETPIVLSKLFASMGFYMLTWLVWGAILIALRVDNGRPFEYRPILSFYLAVAVSGTAFLSMGLFFSSLTRNQIIAAVLTFFCMICLLFFYIAARAFAGPDWQPLFYHLTYINLWWDSLEGRLHLRDVIIQMSVAIFWCFLTVKVLEARRWA
jgi:ABC-2 type transport system permease protein